MRLKTTCSPEWRELKGKSSKNGTVPVQGLSQAFAVQTATVHGP